MAEFDRSSKWLIQHHGGSLLRLAGVRDVVSWRALQAELVQPAQLPDGLLEVERRSVPAAHPFLLEIATYPERRVEQQLLRGTLLVLLDRHVVPEVVAVILRPKGRFRVPRRVAWASPSGSTKVDVEWRVVELWKQPAEPLLRSNDPGLMPWLPLTEFAGRPEPVLHRCREVIDQVAAESERINLLAVTQVLAGLRYNDPRLLAILGGRRIMIESPVLKQLQAEWKAEAKAEDIITFLEARFGSLPADVRAAVGEIRDLSRLDAVIRTAAQCEDVAAFRAHLLT